MREFKLLEHVYAANAGLKERVIIPPGDDLAMVRMSGRHLLAGVDQLVAGRHYDSSTTTDEQIGRKAVARSLSDIAAMAGRPVAALAAVTLPPGFGEERAKTLFDAMQRAASDAQCPLVGGDICIHQDADAPMVIAVTVFAEPTTPSPVTRGGARVGDRVYVTGSLGGAMGGRHLTFQPRIEPAIDLAARLGPRLHAMIDISDGLGRDSSHIAQQSSLSIEIDAERLPCTPGSSWQQAMSDGEDYELCFTATGDVPPEIGGVPITAVGRAVDRSGAPNQPWITVIAGGERYDGDQLGWQHEAEATKPGRTPSGVQQVGDGATDG